MNDPRNAARRPITIRIPPNADVRLTILPPAVIVAPAGSDATLASLTQPGRVSAVLTHDRGVSWPGRSGQMLAARMLEAGNVVVFQFETLADAFACRARLLREDAR